MIPLNMLLTIFLLWTSQILEEFGSFFGVYVLRIIKFWFIRRSMYQGLLNRLDEIEGINSSSERVF